MTRYLVYLYSDKKAKSRDPKIVSMYGYYTGKSYSVNHESFPICTLNEVTEKTKLFKSRKAAINCAEKCYDEFEYVEDYDIEEVFVEE